MSHEDLPSEGAPPALLVDHLLAAEPSHLFLIGCSSADLYLPQDKGELQVIRRFDTLDDAEKFLKVNNSADLSASIAVLNIGPDQAALEQQIGKAVRAFPHRLIIYTKAQIAPDTVFFAFGFRKLNVLDSATADAQSRWYEFRLSHYKQPPDWLNARFWANPMRFNLDDEIDSDSDYMDEEE